MPQPLHHGSAASKPVQVGASVVELALGAHAVEIALGAGGQAPEWIHLLPAGTFTFRDGRGPYQLYDPAAVVAASRANTLGGRLPVDYDHAIDYAAPRGVSSPAAGWIEDIEARSDGMWGRVVWTERGAAAVRSLEYRFLSPVFEHSAAGMVLRVLRAALTNNPAIPNLTALASASTGEETNVTLDQLLAELRTALGAAKDANAATLVASAKAAADGARAALGALGRIATAAGLAQGAKLDDVLAKVTAAAAPSRPDPAQWAPMSVVTELQTQVAALTTTAVADKAAGAVDAAIAAGKVTPAQRTWALGYANADPAGFAGYVTVAPVLASSVPVVVGQPRAAAPQQHPHQVGSDARALVAAAAREGRELTAAAAVFQILHPR